MAPGGGQTTFDFGKIAEGYGDSADIWRAIAARPGLAVVDSTIRPAEALRYE